MNNISEEYRLIPLSEIGKQALAIVLELRELKCHDHMRIIKGLEKNFLKTRPNMVSMFCAASIIAHTMPIPRLDDLIAINVDKKDNVPDIFDDPRTAVEARIGTMDIIGILKILRHTVIEYRKKHTNDDERTYWQFRQNQVDLINDLKPSMIAMLAALAQLTQSTPSEALDWIKSVMEEA